MTREEFWRHDGRPIYRGRGMVERLDFMGGDLAVVNRARQCTATESAELTRRDQGLIAALMRERHGTPFEVSVFTFQVACPIFVAREWFRHRIGSFNEVSGRYTELRPVFFMPNDARAQVGKAMEYRYQDAPELTETLRRYLREECERAWEAYRQLLLAGVAKEQARAVLPVAIFTEFSWTVNARSLMNFLSLRLAPNAMREIRVLAEDVLECFHASMPLTAQAFETCGRVAP